MRNDLENAAIPQPSGLSAAKQALLSKWLRGKTAGNEAAATETIPRRHGSAPATLSLEQQRLWFFQQLEPDSALYTMPIASRLHGRLNPQALQQAMILAVARHEALRTRLTGQEPLQTIDPPSPVPMLSIDLRDHPPEHRGIAARQILETEAKRPFDLSRDLMVRTALIRLDDEEWILLVLMHHVASDDWSWRVFCNEVAVAYEANISGRKAELPEPALQYADFAVWQQAFWRGDVLEKHLAYWRKQLDGTPPVLNLPMDHPRPASQTFRGACEWLKLPGALKEKLKLISEQGCFTPFTILLAAFQTLLHRYTGQEDIVVGSPVAGRTRGCLQHVVGVFVNMLVLRTKLDGNPTFAELLRRTQTTVLEALAQQELPFEKLVEELQPHRSASYSPLIQVMFALQDELSENLRLPGLAASPFPLDTRTAKFDLTFTIVKSSSGFDCCAEYNTDLFEPNRVRHMLGHYQRLLEAIAADFEQRLSELPLLAESERNQLLTEWNRTECAFSRDRCVHELFATQAANVPDSSALVCGGQTLTYSEVNRRSNQLARFLQNLGAGPDTLVAIAMDRSLDMVIALLATLKAGAAYLPLDPSYPAERLRFMLEDSGTSILLTCSGEEQQMTDLPKSISLVCIDAVWSDISQESDSPSPSEINPENLAYVIYTSGSTGLPKGVQISHRAVANLLESMQREPGLTRTDTLLSVTSISFDIAALEIFLPLTAGARVVIATSDEIFDAAKMKELIRDSGATVMQATPSYWQFLVDSRWEGNRRLKILCGGESLSRSLANQLLERASEVWNLYGPTETTIWSTLSKVAANNQSISIGRPIANTQIYLLDPHLQPVPVGIAGELFIGGEGVARGYLNQPEPTAQRFIPNPFSPNSRLYKTGDVARYRDDGTIEWLGRNDFQMKLRGHRIDLGEIESTLRNHPSVSEAVALVKSDTNPDGNASEKTLVAYVVAANGVAPDAGELQKFLGAKLPDYMVPSAFIALEKFPLTPNGKIDRKALPSPLPAHRSEKPTFAPPRTDTEQTLAQIWQDLLRISQVGIHDNFFEVGGHSLLAMQLMVRVSGTLQKELSLRNVFKHPTIAELAELLDKAQEQPSAEISPARAQRLSPARAQELLGNIDTLTDAEVESLLQQVSTGSEDSL